MWIYRYRYWLSVRWVVTYRISAKNPLSCIPGLGIWWIYKLLCWDSKWTPLSAFVEDVGWMSHSNVSVSYFSAPSASDPAICRLSGSVPAPALEAVWRTQHASMCHTYHTHPPGAGMVPPRLPVFPIILKKAHVYSAITHWDLFVSQAHLYYVLCTTCRQGALQLQFFLIFNSCFLLCVSVYFTLTTCATFWLK